jgi:hypothetical protein
MGGKGSGRKVEFNDEQHKKVREWQLQYDRAIAKIRKNHKCSFQEAQLILRKRTLEEELKKLQNVPSSH